ncbi:MAG: ABC transporter ATP-binding protein [Christensenellales bacterium]
MDRLTGFLKPYRKELIIGPAFKLAEAVLELLPPIIMAAVIDAGVKGGEEGIILPYGAWMLLVAAVGFLCALVCQYHAAAASQGVGTDLRSALFKKIGTLSYAQLDELNTASLVNRITSDVNQLQFAVAMLIRLVIRAPFLCIGGLVVTLLIDPMLSLILLAVIVLFGVMLYVIMTRVVPLYKRVQARLDAMFDVVREHLGGVRVIRAFVREKGERRRFRQVAGEHTETMVRVGRIIALTNPLTLLVMNLGVAAVVWFGGIRVDAGVLTTGGIIAFISYVNSILAAMIVVASLLTTFTRAAASYKRVQEVLALTPQLTYGEGVAENVQACCAIAFEHVNFRYPDAQEDMLHDICFSIEGGSLGVIGGTGSGKSTLAELMMRFYDVSEGCIRLGGANVKDYTREQLQKKIAIAPQKSVLFSGTVADNIRLGRFSATMQEIQEAAKCAQIHEFIRSLPDGYDTKVLAGGRNFSGGQRQRIAIARTLAIGAHIVILDDAGSALDYATEARLRREIAKLPCTCVIISQRVASVRNCTRILVLEEGSVAGFGTHEALSESCAAYQEIMCAQEGGDV